MITAGRLDQRITLQAATVTRDAVGGPMEAWADLVTLWANVRDLSGKAIHEAEQVGSSVTRRVTIRHRSGVTAALRVKFDDARVAKVAYVREVGRREFIELDCEMLT